MSERAWNWGIPALLVGIGIATAIFVTPGVQSSLAVLAGLLIGFGSALVFFSEKDWKLREGGDDGLP